MKNISTREQYAALTRDKLLGIEECPFCDSVSQAGHTVWKGKYWYILRNIFPYSGDEDHLMAVPYDHKAFSHELTVDEILELAYIYAFMKSYY
jgi:diadenosine tetraphosphate (Ap4A) HIT family hydrolase